MLRYGLLAGVGLTITVAVACSSKSSGPSSGGNNGTQSAAQHGEELVKSYNCPFCHGQDMAGQTTPIQVPAGTVAQCLSQVRLYPPNLTPDPDTGIGKWTDDQLRGAIIDGIDNLGEDLCPEMKHYKDAGVDDVNDIIAYLRSISPVKKTIPGSNCPPLKGDCDGGV